MIHTETSESQPDEKPMSGRILVVDDVAANVRLLQGILTIEGFEVDPAMNGEAALEFSRNAPDVILLDVMMPDMDGFEVCRRLRMVPATAHTPIVMVTALHETADRVRAIEAGADDFLTKPVDAVEVVARVRSLVQAKRDRDALEQALADLRRAEAMRDSLAQMLVHDLRTPLTSMLAATEMLRTYYSASLDETQRELVMMCSNGCTQMMALVNELLDVAKMESGQLQLMRVPVEIGKAIEESFDQVRAIATSNDVILESDIAPGLAPVEADGALLRRVLVNLLGNALKFSPRYESVRLSARYDGDDALLLGVHDRGPGIPPEYRERIFDKWGQMEVRQEGEKYSSGLGLTFCRLAIEAHGGEIWVDSSENEQETGSVFYIRLPLSAS